MKREILFKAKSLFEHELETKDVKKGEWVYGYFIQIGKDSYINCCPISDNVEVDINTLCQFTGLLDKNCNRIFEGDISDDPRDGDGVQWRVFWNNEDACYHCAIHNNSLWGMSETVYSSMALHLATKLKMFEIIGNIYD